MDKKLMILVMVMVAMLLSACEAALNSEEFQQKLIEANGNIQSYSLDMDMNMDMTLTGEGKSMEIGSATKANGEVDVANKQMHMTMAVTADALGQKQKTDMELYSMGDSIYIQTQGQWIKTPFDQKVWDQQDSVKNTLELIKSGTIDLLPDETIDGRSFYVVKVKPDMRKLVEQTMQGSGSDLPADMDFNKVMKSFDVIIWVNQDTFVMERSKTNMQMEMSSEDMGQTGAAGGSMAIDMSVDAKMSDINEPVSITLPAAASDAIDASQFGTGAAPIAGNAVAGITG